MIINNQLVEKKLYQRTTQVEFKPLKQIWNYQNQKYIYILLSKNGQNIKIIYHEENRELYESKGYKIIGKKLGSSRELDLTNKTLKELGNHFISTRNTYVYTKYLINDLNTLGYSTIASKIIKKNIFTP